LPIFYIAVYLSNKDEIAVYEDRFYVPYFTTEHLERFLKRPDTFTFQQFKIEGVTQSFLLKGISYFLCNLRNILSLLGIRWNILYKYCHCLK
jgi:hypothetical protein